MTATDLVWQHVMVNAKRSWLHGDERGFRSRRHRVHSSGDHKHPPPTREHEDLRLYHRERSGKAVSFALCARVAILRAFVIKMRKLDRRIIACTVAKQHLHGLAELPDAYRDVKEVLGKCKQYASHQAPIVGSIWSEGFKRELIRDKRHLHNTYAYLRCKQEAGTVVWSHRPEENWIDHPELGVIVMLRGRKRTRIVPKPRPLV